MLAFQTLQSSTNVLWFEGFSLEMLALLFAHYAFSGKFIASADCHLVASEQIACSFYCIVL